MEILTLNCVFLLHVRVCKGKTCISMKNLPVRVRTVPNEKTKIRFDESQLIDSLIIRVVTGRNHEANHCFIDSRISYLIDIP